LLVSRSEQTGGGVVECAIFDNKHVISAKPARSYARFGTRIKASVVWRSMAHPYSGNLCRRPPAKGRHLPLAEMLVSVSFADA
jgi:hypothetical protein